jgi:hypothetical protein
MLCYQCFVRADLLYMTFSLEQFEANSLAKQKTRSLNQRLFTL